MGKRDKRRSKERRKIRKERMKEAERRFSNLKPVNLNLKVSGSIPNIIEDEDE